jgi:hypothetical protein
VRLQGADQRTGLTLRPQGGVHLEEGLRRQAHHFTGNPGGEGIGILADEDDVYVADVVQFPRTTFTHRDHGQPGWGLGFADIGHRDLQRCIQCRVGQVGEVRTDGGELQDGLILDRGSQVQRREHHQLVSIDGAQLRHHRRW